PDSTILMDYILHRLANVLEKLRILPENMERNLKGSYQLFFSQRVLLALVESGMERGPAYEMVQKIAMRCWEEKRQFPDQVRADKGVAASLSREKLDEIFDMGYYLRQEDLIFKRVFS
ncbi:MAG: adenylosuccinate lyase, partial [Thermodesulfobacteriota bacterium]|nr:adenylosuccinate lyase [Thermodesulfobacteriota bacterium]